MRTALDHSFRLSSPDLQQEPPALNASILLAKDHPLRRTKSAGSSTSRFHISGRSQSLTISPIAAIHVDSEVKFTDCIQLPRNQQVDSCQQILDDSVNIFSIQSTDRARRRKEYNLQIGHLLYYDSDVMITTTVCCSYKQRTSSNIASERNSSEVLWNWLLQ